MDFRGFSLRRFGFDKRFRFTKEVTLDESYKDYFLDRQTNCLCQIFVGDRCRMRHIGDKDIVTNISVEGVVLTESWIPRIFKIFIFKFKLSFVSENHNEWILGFLSIHSNGSLLKNPEISGAIFTLNLSILILNSQCEEGARDFRVL